MSSTADSPAAGAAVGTISEAPATPTTTRGARLARRLGIRTRILAWFVVLLGAALLTTLVVTRTVLMNGVDSDADARLNANADDFRLAVNDAHLEVPGSGPLTKVMNDYLSRRVARPDEAQLAIVSGRPFAASAGSPVALDRLPEVGAWGGLLVSSNGTLETTAGPARSLAVPIVSQNRTLGTMVFVDFVGVRHDQVDNTVRSLGVILGVVFLAAAFAAFGSAGRTLRPLRRLSSTARSVSSGTDLDARIEVAGHDEVTDLGESFNGMMERLEQAFDSQKQFLDNAGHELRTPLTIVRGHLELLDLEDPDERRLTVSIVFDELDRMERLVDELRVLARSERPDFLHPEYLNVADLTHELLLKSVTLADREFDIDDMADVEIIADKARITEAVMNLVQNAVHMTEAGDTLAIGSSCDGKVVKVWVRDSGPGIAPELQPHLFEKSRNPDELKRRGGTGLGIPLALAIARAHDGTLGVSSRPGQGSTFVLVIPAKGLRPPERTTDAQPTTDDDTPFRRIPLSVRHQRSTPTARKDDASTVSTTHRAT